MSAVPRKRKSTTVSRLFTKLRRAGDAKKRQEAKKRKKNNECVKVPITRSTLRRACDAMDGSKVQWPALGTDRLSSQFRDLMRIHRSWPSTNPAELTFVELAREFLWPCALSAFCRDTDYHGDEGYNNSNETTGMRIDGSRASTMFGARYVSRAFVFRDGVTTTTRYRAIGGFTSVDLDEDERRGHGPPGRVVVHDGSGPCWTEFARQCGNPTVCLDVSFAYRPFTGDFPANFDPKRVQRGMSIETRGNYLRGDRVRSMSFYRRLYAINAVVWAAVEWLWHRTKNHRPVILTASRDLRFMLDQDHRFPFLIVQRRESKLVTCFL